MNKLLLIDGNSIMNRAFYGLPLLSDAKEDIQMQSLVFKYLIQDY